MAINRYDQTLKMIARNKSLYKVPESFVEDEILEDLIQAELVRKNGDGGYVLTAYGEIIEVLGYQSHTKQKTIISGECRNMKNWFYYTLIVLFMLFGILFFLF